jgi:uncharacterized protein (DUF2141 family)
VKQTIHRILACPIIATISFFCAGQVPPSGGPPDTTPPEIIRSYPLPGALHYRDNRFSLAFSKYVDRSSVEGSMFISPSVGQLTFDWSGTEVEMQFSDSLRPDATYIITIGTDVVDTRKNRMARAFALPFSTGGHLDSASVSGRVFDPAPAGVMIFAYSLYAGNPDTLNPTRSKPDYETQTGKDGTFNLTNLAPGRYRLIAVRDQYRNLLYDPQTDEYGMATTDIALDSLRPRISGIQFQLTREDTTRPFLSSARPIDRSHVLLKFSELMDTTGVRVNNISIDDTASGAKLPVYDFSFMEGSSLAAQIYTADQESSKTYRVRLSGLRDVHANILDTPPGTGIFTGTAVPDTTKPSMKIENVQEGDRGIQPDDSIHAAFSEAIRPLPFERGFSLTDTAKHAVAGGFKWWNSAQVSFVPSAPLALSTPYVLRIALDSMRDLSGNHLRDSILTRKFSTVDEKTLGSIKGEVRDDSSGARGKIYILAANISNSQVKPRRLVLGSPGPFVLDRVIEGKYTITAFRDADGNGRYSYGTPFPFRPSERFAMFTDTLRVRARWPLEGVVISFR